MNPSQWNTITPDEIRAGREALGYTQQELGEFFGVSGLTVSRWERGDSSVAIPGAVKMALEFLRVQKVRGDSDLLKVLAQKAAEIEALKAKIEREREEEVWNREANVSDS